MESIWKSMESIWKKYGKGMESIHQKYGIHPPFHGIHPPIPWNPPGVSAVHPSMDSTWNNLGRVKYCLFYMYVLVTSLEHGHLPDQQGK